MHPLNSASLIHWNYLLSPLLFPDYCNYPTSVNICILFWPLPIDIPPKLQKNDGKTIFQSHCESPPQLPENTIKNRTHVFKQRNRTAWPTQIKFFSTQCRLRVMAGKEKRLSTNKGRVRWNKIEIQLMQIILNTKCFSKNGYPLRLAQKRLLENITQKNITQNISSFLPLVRNSPTSASQKRTPLKSKKIKLNWYH